jgi:hypothetical protein
MEELERCSGGRKLITVSKINVLRRICGYRKLVNIIKDKVIQSRHPIILTIHGSHSKIMARMIRPAKHVTHNWIKVYTIYKHFGCKTERGATVSEM